MYRFDWRPTSCNCHRIRYIYDTVCRNLEFDAYDNRRYQLLHNFVVRNGHTTTFDLCRIYREILGGANSGPNAWRQRKTCKNTHRNVLVMRVRENTRCNAKFIITRARERELWIAFGGVTQACQHRVCWDDGDCLTMTWSRESVNLGNLYIHLFSIHARISFVE